MARGPRIPFSYWPGGVPAYVKTDETPVANDDLNSLTNGWRYFIKEKWVPRPSGEQDQFYEVKQRRELISEWAQAPQSQRDEYQALAAPNPTEWKYHTLKQYAPNNGWSDVAWYTCIAPLDTPLNRALWTKLRILSYDLRNGDMLQGIIMPGAFSASPHSASPILEPKDFMKGWAVENADFQNMAMTVQGTVVFQGRTEWVLADQQALDTGMLLWVSLESNGSVRLKLRITIMEFETMYNEYFGSGRGIEPMRHSYGYDGANEDVDEGIVGDPIDLSRPILEVFGDLASRPELETELAGGEERWRELIETIAPGYLELEEAGSADTYDGSKFKKI